MARLIFLAWISEAHVARTCIVRQSCQVQPDPAQGNPWTSSGGSLLLLHRRLAGGNLVPNLFPTNFARQNLGMNP